MTGFFKYLAAVVCVITVSESHALTCGDVFAESDLVAGSPHRRETFQGFFSQIRNTFQLPRTETEESSEILALNIKTNDVLLVRRQSDREYALVKPVQRGLTRQLVSAGRRLVGLEQTIPNGDYILENGIHLNVGSEEDVGFFDNFIETRLIAHPDALMAKASENLAKHGDTPSYRALERNWKEIRSRILTGMLNPDALDPSQARVGRSERTGKQYVVVGRSFMVPLQGVRRSPRSLVPQGLGLHSTETLVMNDGSRLTLERDSDDDF